MMRSSSDAVVGSVPGRYICVEERVCCGGRQLPTLIVVCVCVGQMQWMPNNAWVNWGKFFNFNSNTQHSRAVYTAIIRFIAFIEAERQASHVRTFFFRFGLRMKFIHGCFAHTHTDTARDRQYSAFGNFSLLITTHAITYIYRWFLHNNSLFGRKKPKKKKKTEINCDFYQF